MKEFQKVLPKWILIVSSIFSLMEIMVSVSLWISPESVLESVDLHAKGVDYVIKMWAVRQFALGIIFAFATIRKSGPMLTIAYIFFLVMFIGDFFIGLTAGESALVISAVVMGIISSALLFFINRK